MSTRETFSNSIDLAEINEYEKDSVMQNLTVLPQVRYVACRKVLWNGTL